MKKTLLLIFMFSQLVFAQSAPPKYEVELVKNPNKGGKDTREVNAVLIFDREALIIKSRRKSEVFKEFKYSDIKYVEHSFSKNPLMTDNSKAIILAMMIGNPIFLLREEKHWLTILTDDDFAVLKIENDNYRLLRMEFLVRKAEVININEDRQ